MSESSSPPATSPGSLAGTPCPCQTPQDPQAVTNPPGQPSISYRVDDFTGFRRALLRPLDRETALGLWRPGPGDLGLQVLEWWAYLGDILTFYNERIANETYLRTAQLPSSISGLVALLGYQPAPGLAATGQVAAVRSQSHPAEPLVLPQGMQMSSSATPGVPAQIFEVTSTSTFSGTTNVTATLPPDKNLDISSSSNQPASVLLAGKVTAAKTGDRLVLVSSTWAGKDDNWSLVTVASVGPETDPGTGAVNTRVTFNPAAVWGTAPPAGTAPAAPPPPNPDIGPATSYALLRPTASAALWSPSGLNVSPPAEPADGSTVFLSTVVRAIRPGDTVLFDGGSSTSSVLAVVTSAQDRTGTMSFPETLSPPVPDIILPYTVLGLASKDPTVGSYDPTVVTVRYNFRPVGTVIANPVGSLPSLPSLGAQVSVPGSFTLSSGVTSAFLVDANGSATLVGLAGGAGTLNVTPAPPAPSTFDPPLAAPFTLYLDLVPVARGVTVHSETLGSGNAAVANQSFTLQKSPLTYLASGTTWVSTLTVYVDGVQWTEVPTMYGQAPTAQVYVIERSVDQTATVRFGDGVNGACLTSGSGNVMATYRYGSGAATPPAGRLTTAVNQQPNLASIQNPVAVSTGAADPQSPANVKANAPASVLSFGRAISAVDYEVVASQAPGVTRARAYWTFDTDHQRNLVKIYVNDDAGGVQAAAQALAGADDPNRPVVVSAAQPIDVSLSGTLVVDPARQVDDVIAAATTSIIDPTGGAFSPARMGIGQWLYRSYVEAALSVPGVIAVHQLRVTWTTAPSGREFILFLRTLDNVADPGEGSYFELLPDNLQITGGYSDD